MSTAGKVLIILIVLFSIVLVILMAADAQLHNQRAIQLHDAIKRQKDFQKQVDQEKAKIDKAKFDTAREQEAATREMILLDQRLTSLERTLSSLREDLSRYQIDLKRLDTIISANSRSREFRAQELAAVNKNIDDSRKLVTQVKKFNGELRLEVERMRDEFQSTLAQNKQLVEKLKKFEGTTKPPAKPTSTALNVDRAAR